MSQDMVRLSDLGREVGLLHEVLVTGRKVGADREFYTKLAHDKALFDRVVSLVRGLEPTKSQEWAQSIMGSDFVDIPSVEKSFGVQFTPEQLQRLSVVPFSEETLERCRPTHLLFPGLPLSIQRLRGKANGSLVTSDGQWLVVPFTEHGQDIQRWEEKEPWVTEPLEVRWNLVRKGMVPHSADKRWEDQQALLYQGEYVPKAVEVVFALFLSLLARRESEWGTAIWMLRCQDTTHRLLTSLGSRVIVTFSQSRITIADRTGRRYYDYDCGGVLGLASAHEPQTTEYVDLRGRT